MAVQNKVLYAFRGWIAFVAFMDLGTAGRSYIEKRSFLNNNGENEHLDGKFILIKKNHQSFQKFELLYCSSIHTFMYIRWL